MPSAEKTSASQTSTPLPEIHSVWRMGLTIHSCVTIHWRRVWVFMTSPPQPARLADFGSTWRRRARLAVDRAQVLDVVAGLGGPRCVVRRRPPCL